MCDASLDFTISDGQPADPRLVTAEKTWQTFMSALRSGDKGTLAECFHPSERQKYMQALEQMSTEQLRGWRISQL